MIQIYKIKKILGLVLSLTYCSVLFANSNSDSILTISIWNGHFTEALNLIEKSKKNATTSDQSLLLLKQSDIYIKQGNLTAAEKLLENISVKKASYSIRFNYTLQRGKYFYFSGKNNEALKELAKSESMISHINDKKNITELYEILGKYYHAAYDYENAAKYFEMAVNLQNEKIKSERICRMLYYSYLANIYRNIKQYQKANEVYNYCLNFSDSIVDSNIPILIEFYTNLAGYSFLNSTDEADRFLDEAILIGKSFFNKQHYLFCDINYLKSKIEYARNDYENALMYCNNLQNILKLYPFLYQYHGLNYSLIVSIYFWYKKDYKEAIKYCNIALSEIKIISDPSLPFFHYILGLSYSRLNDHVLSKQYLNKVISMTSDYASDANVHNNIKAYLYLGKIERMENNSTKSFYYFNRALFISKKYQPEENNLLPMIYYELAKSCLLLSNEFDLALKHIQNSIIAGSRTFKDISYYKNPEVSDVSSKYMLIESFSLKAYLLFKLYESNQNLKYLKESLRCQELSLDLYQKIIYKIDDENSGLNLIDLKVNALNNAVSYSTLLYLKTKDYTYAEKAFEYTEKSKMQLLLIKTLENKSKYSGGVPDSMITKEEYLDHKIIETENLLVLNEKLRPDLVLQEKQLHTLTNLYNQRDELVNMMEKSYPAYYKAKYSFKVSGIKEIQKILKKDQVILEYQLLKTEIITFVITTSTFYIHYQLIDKNVPLEIIQLRKAISEDPIHESGSVLFTSFVSSSQYLYEKLIQPVYHLIRNKRLIIIPHNDLTQIPFEVLITGLPATNQPMNYRKLNYLICEFPMIYAYSANLLLDEGDQKKKNGRGTAIFLPEYSGNPTSETYVFPELKGAAAEAKAVKKLSHGKLFDYDRASEASFKAEANRFRVLHIASHTVLDSINPFLSRMVLTAQDSVDDGHLYAYEISQLKLRAQLVVLSGCNTGYGILRRSEGLISIARSFFYTGVHTIAYTLWPVADKAGFALTDLFYREVKKDQEMDIAMRNAKLAYLKNADPVKTHPYYWANYIIVGNTDTVHLKKYPFLPLLLIGLPILLVLLYLILRKNRRKQLLADC